MAVNDRKSKEGSIEELEQEDVALSSSELDNIINSAEIKREDGDTEDDALEQYGVWVKIKPEEIEGNLEEEASFELSDLESSDESHLTEEEEDLLGELEVEPSPETSTKTGEEELPEPGEFGLDKDIDMDMDSLPDLELEDLEAEEMPEPEEEITLPTADEELEDFSLEEMPGPEAAEELPVLELEEEAEIDLPLSDETNIVDRFDDLGALETELMSADAGLGAVQEDSSEILQKIEKELKSIRKDIRELKKELSGLGKVEQTPGEVEVQPVSPEAKGFFDEEEDETIALTGDELDNILNTADVTEEAADKPEITLEEQLSARGGPQAVTEEPHEEVKEAEVSGTEVVEEPGEVEINIDEQEIEEAFAPTLGVQRNTSAPAMEMEQLEQVPEEEVSLEIEEPAGEEKTLETLEAEVPEMETPEEELTPDEDSKEVQEAEIELELPSENEIDLSETPMEELEALTEKPAAAEELTLEEAPEAEIPEVEMPEEELTLEEAPEAEIPELEMPEEELTLEEAPEEAAPEDGAAPIELEPETALQADQQFPEELKSDIKSVLSYLDQLLESLPEEKIREFANSKYLPMYKKLFEDLGLEA